MMTATRTQLWHTAVFHEVMKSCQNHPERFKNEKPSSQVLYRRHVPALHLGWCDRHHPLQCNNIPKYSETVRTWSMDSITFFLSAIKYFNLLTALILKCGGRNLNEDDRQFTSSSLYQVFLIWSHFYTGCMMTKIKTSHSFFKLKLTYSFSLLCFSSASASRALACCSLASVSFCCRSRRLLIFSKLCRDKQSQPQTVAFFIHPSADSFVDE